MKYVIIGGDERMPYLYRMLKDDGKSVSCFASDTAPLPPSAHCESPSDGNIFILPVPVERDGFLNAPFSAGRYTIDEIFKLLPEGAFVCGGMPSAKAYEKAEAAKVRLHDYMKVPSLVVGNAAITAEAAVRILMDASPRSLAERKILVIGRGRIGKLLGDKLRALGTDVWVSSGNPEAAAFARTVGFNVLSPDDPVSDFDAVVNTAPAVTLSDKRQRDLKSGCFLLELASKKGFDENLVSHCRLQNAPGLPAKYAPESAAKLMLDAVKITVKEHYYEREKSRS